MRLETSPAEGIASKARSYKKKGCGYKPHLPDRSSMVRNRTYRSGHSVIGAKLIPARLRGSLECAASMLLILPAC